jgi:hypothetical protein
VQSQSAWEIVRDDPPTRILLVLSTFCKQIDKGTSVIFRHASKKSRNRLQKACCHIRVDVIIVSQVYRYDYSHESFRQDALKIRHDFLILAVCLWSPGRGVFRMHCRIA